MARWTTYPGRRGDRAAKRPRDRTRGPSSTARRPSYDRGTCSPRLQLQLRQAGHGELHLPDRHPGRDHRGAGRPGRRRQPDLSHGAHQYLRGQPQPHRPEVPRQPDEVLPHPEPAARRGRGSGTRCRTRPRSCRPCATTSPSSSGSASRRSNELEAADVERVVGQVRRLPPRTLGRGRRSGRAGWCRPAHVRSGRGAQRRRRARVPAECRPEKPLSRSMPQDAVVAALDHEVDAAPRTPGSVRSPAAVAGNRWPESSWPARMSTAWSLPLWPAAKPWGTSTGFSAVLTARPKSTTAWSRSRPDRETHARPVRRRLLRVRGRQAC